MFCNPPSSDSDKESPEYVEEKWKVAKAIYKYEDTPTPMPLETPQGKNFLKEEIKEEELKLIPKDLDEPLQKAESNDPFWGF